MLGEQVNHLRSHPTRSPMTTIFMVSLRCTAAKGRPVVSEVQTTRRFVTTPGPIERTRHETTACLVLIVKPPQQQTKERKKMPDETTASQPRSTAWQNAVTVLQEASPP